MIRTRIVGVEGKNTDHLTTTMATLTIGLFSLVLFPWRRENSNYLHSNQPGECQREQISEKNLSWLFLMHIVFFSLKSGVV